MLRRHSKHPYRKKDSIYVYVENNNFLKKTRKFISKGYSTYPANAVDISREGKKIVNYVSIINENLDDFPDELPGLPRIAFG